MALDAPLLVSEHFPYLPVEVQVEGMEWDGEMLVDTGFDGDLILPSVLQPATPPHTVVPWRLVDGSLAGSPTYRGGGPSRDDGFVQRHSGF